MEAARSAISRCIIQSVEHCLFTIVLDPAARNPSEGCGVTARQSVHGKMSQLGQKAKYSPRADFFRFGPNSGSG